LLPPLTLNPMEVNHSSSQEQVIIPKIKKPFLETTLDQVAGCLKYLGKAKSLDEMEDAIRQGVTEQSQVNSKHKS
jgi:hypothetical protein